MVALSFVYCPVHGMRRLPKRRLSPQTRLAIAAFWGSRGNIRRV